MPWVKLDDRLPMSLKIRGLCDDGATGDRKKDQINVGLGHFIQLLTWVGGEGTNGFVTRDAVEQYGTAASTARLLRAKFERSPLLHELDERGRPPACPCLEGRTWKRDFQYLIHDYLDRNPSKEEHNVHAAKKRELRNAALKGAVRIRDADMCRYCGKFCKHTDRVSDDALQFDHVDPEIANGIDNLVVACKGCNGRKGKRTPFQANMVLLDAPTTRPTTVPGLVVGQVAGLVAAPDAAPGTSLPPDQRRDPASSQAENSPGRDGDGIVVGHRVPPSVPIGPPTPRLTGSPQSPYLREQRPYPELHAGHPPQTEEAS